MSVTFRGFNMTPVQVTITQDRYDELREAEKHAIETIRENYNAEHLKEVEQKYRELSDMVSPNWFVVDIPHGELLKRAHAQRMVCELRAQEKESEAS